MENIKAILAANIVGTLATVNKDGSPWATPLHIFADETALYWFSKDTQQHSLNIENDARVSVSLWGRNDDGTLGGYISGSAVKLSEQETVKSLEIVVATLGAIPPYFEGTFGYKLDLGSPDLSKSSPKRWYFYT